jgi:hypothetical protein
MNNLDRLMEIDRRLRKLENPRCYGELLPEDKLEVFTEIISFLRDIIADMLDKEVRESED